jgi:CheY-like chemotaxis protein
MHGGEVRAESEGDGRGATFTVELPLSLHASMPGDEPAAQILQAKTSGGTSGALTGLRVLLVEDEVHTRQALICVLQNSGARVTAVGTAAEARHALSAAGSDLLVSDVGLPGENGYALMRSIRVAEGEHAEKRLASLALTAYARDEDRDQAIAAGFDAYAPKPVEPRELVGALATLGLRSARPL